MSSQSVKPSRLFMPAAVGTVVMGIGAAVLLIVHMRQPAPVVIEKPPVIIKAPPETRVVEKVVRVEVPAPPPVVVAPKVEPLENRVLTTVPKVKSEWEGVWRRKETPVPMFKVGQDGQEGTCAANWGPIVAWRGGVVTGDALEFVVDTELSPVHVRMTMTGAAKSKVEQWVTDADWMVGLQRANKVAKTPLQRKALIAALLKNAQKFRKPVMIGIFTCQAD